VQLPLWDPELLAAVRVVDEERGGVALDEALERLERRCIGGL
jgi:hypothetical protein